MYKPPKLDSWICWTVSALDGAAPTVRLVSFKRV
uniref:Uncharacterized protein n=1 Tax=Ascaris lumbricoides TaxID=6252 RepID=A0A0M3I2Z3_ASCLU